MTELARKERSVSSDFTPLVKTQKRVVRGNRNGVDGRSLRKRNRQCSTCWRNTLCATLNRYPVKQTMIDIFTLNSATQNFMLVLYFSHEQSAQFTQKKNSHRYSYVAKNTRTRRSMAHSNTSGHDSNYCCFRGR